MDKGFECNTRNHKTPKENKVAISLGYVSVCFFVFWIWHLKQIQQKEKKKKRGLHQTKNNKGNHQDEEPTKWKKIFAYHISDKWLMCKIKNSYNSVAKN